MKLAETQRVFWHLATRSPSAEPQSARELFVGTSSLDADSRISIYADMYFWRQIDSLREDFPKLAALLGDEGFHQFAEQYVRAHPSEHPDLGQLGRKVAAFMAERAGPRPDLADLAALEWARAEVFDEAHAEPAEMQLGGPDSRLRLAPALRLLALRHDVLSLWSALEEDRPPPPPRAGATHVAVWRKGFIPMHAAIDGGLTE